MSLSGDSQSHSSPHTFSSKNSLCFHYTRIIMYGRVSLFHDRPPFHRGNHFVFYESYAKTFFTATSSLLGSNPSGNFFVSVTA